MLRFKQTKSIQKVSDSNSSKEMGFLNPNYPLSGESGGVI